jgi:hypothetical protein
VNIDYAERARALVGTRFRPQGRGELGLDCIGVAIATYALKPSTVRGDYRLKGNHVAEMRDVLHHHFRRVPVGQARTGDLLLMQVASDQLHFAVKTEAGFVHAHAALRRVVETPGTPEWPVLGTYRRRRH